jgi:protein-disulfide isomerase
LAALLLLVLTTGCKAQTPAAGAIDAKTQRRIEVMVRTQFDLPADYDLVLGTRSPSQFAGYDTLPVTFKRGSKTQSIDFLIATDNSKLAHLDTMDLTKDPAAQIPIAGRPVRGNPDAKVTVVGFDDLECGYCGLMHKELFPETLDRYKGLVRFVYKDFPLVELHPWALHAAVDANCLADQSGDVYWTYVDYLHSHGDEVTGETRDPAKSYAALDRIARQEATLGKLDSARLDACIAKQDASVPQMSAKFAEALGIQGTPALFVNGERINGGAVPQQQVWMVIDRALRAEGIQPPPLPLPAAPTPAAAATPAATGNVK